MQLYKQLVNVLAGFVAARPTDDWTVDPDGCQIFWQPLKFAHQRRAELLR
jgi:hypothetical protein